MLCSLMLATCSVKEFRKVHPDATRNAHDMQTITGRICRVEVFRSPTQVTINPTHHMLLMFHVTVGICVQTITWFMSLIIGNAQIFPELFVGSTN
jgi:hypothetical protein